MLSPRIPTLIIAAVGSILVFASLLWYQIVLGGSIIGSEDVGRLEEIAYTTLALIFVGLVLAFLGIIHHLRRMPSGNNIGRIGSPITKLSSMISDGRSAKAFALAGLGYGLFFGVVSSTFVFQPGLSFSDAYGVRVPSVVPVLCCGTIGQVPQLVVYVTQQFAILIIPLNLILLFTMSFLVGLNAAVATYAYANRPVMAGSRWIGGVGAVVGFFTVCPTCAGFFLLATAGPSGAVALALTLSSLQTIFIATSIPILAIAPILASRRLSNVTACAIGKENSRIS